MLPLVDVAPLLDGSGVAEVARHLDSACRRYGFARIAGHGVPVGQIDQLLELSRAFFALPDDVKAEIAMEHAGPAWRGWFPIGAELTSGVPDGKEGIYFGEELPADHPAVVAGTPLHGPNLFPAEPAGLCPAVLAWMDAMSSLGQTLLGALAIGLGLEHDWFARHATAQRDLAGFRNVLVHGYADVDLGIVRDVVETRLDDLLAFVAAIRRTIAG